MEAALSPEMIFQIANIVAIAGWVALLGSFRFPVVADRISGLAIPLLLSVAYAGLILGYWAQGEGGFGSLDDVAALFQTRELLLAGWIHYLAFDLFIGAWIVRTARAADMPFLFVVPCLALTFLFGPVGFLLFAAMRMARTSPLATASR
jgi:hypothetical protein